MSPTTTQSATGWYPFWFWNDQLSEEEIRWQIQQMAAQGLRGFLPSPRQGLKVPYLSDDFFKMIGVAIDEAKKHGMVVHLYDELPYPSGAAGGEVLLGNPHFHATALVQKTFDAASGGSIRLELPRGKILNCIACPVKNDGSVDWSQPTDLTSAIGIVLIEDSYQEVGLTAYNRKRYFSNVATPILQTTLPPGPHRFFVSAQTTLEHHKYYFHFIDTLNPEAVREFFRVTHDRYFSRFGAEFGKTIRSIFTDETAPGWSERLPAEFLKQTGYELLPLLPALQDAQHPQHGKVSADLHRVKYELFVDAFEKPYAEWCRNHGIMYWGEKPLSRLSQLKFSDVPGCDAGHVKAGAPLDLVSAQLRTNPRAAASAAYFYDKPAALCECYHSLGWGATLQDLKRLADGLLLHGITYFVPHAFFYSTHGLKKHDAPPSMFFQMPYWPMFGQLVRRSEKILKAFEGTHIAAEHLVIDPTPGVPSPAQLESFVRIQEQLLASSSEYLLVDVDTLRNAAIEDRVLRIKELRVSVVIVPPQSQIEPILGEMLEHFERQGITVIRGEPEAEYMWRSFDPFLRITATTGDLRNLHRVKRRGHNRTLWFILNAGSSPIDLQLHADSLSEIALDNEASLEQRSGHYFRRLEAHESVLLSSESGESVAPPSRITITLPAQWELKPLNSNLLPLRDWRLTITHDDGTTQSADVAPAPVIHQLEQGRFRFSPVVRRAFGSIAQLLLPMLQLQYTAQFENEYAGPVMLVMEPGSLQGEWTVRINDSRPLSCSPVAVHVRGSLGTDVTSLLKRGHNQITVDIRTDRVDGGLLNCLYLAGDFGVRLAPQRMTHPISVGAFGRWEENGLPFYAGIIEYRATANVASIAPVIEIPFDPNLLGDDACEISFNGGAWHAMPWSPRIVRPNPGELIIGENDVRLRVYTTLLRAFEGQRFDVPTHRAVDVGR